MEVPTRSMLLAVLVLTGCNKGSDSVGIDASSDPTLTLVRCDEPGYLFHRVHAEGTAIAK